MLAKTTFSTANREDYINAAIAGAADVVRDLQTHDTLFVGIKGPMNAGKSLFMDALIHALDDHLDTNAIPIRKHMMLETYPDEARHNYISSQFNINASPTNIGFINVDSIWLATIWDLEKLAEKPGIHLFSLQLYKLEHSAEQLYESIPYTSLYEIDDMGEGLQRHWTKYAPR